MSIAPHAPRSPGINWRFIALLIASASVVILVAANAPLVYVAFDSQPGCVPHAKEAGQNGAFRAARSAC
jgi:hypothetical protein